MKNILLLVHEDSGQEARLQAALDLARTLNGHLQCVDLTILPSLMLDDYDGMGSALLLDEERRRESENKAALEDRLTREDVPWDWVDTTATPTEGVIDAAALADVIVLNSGLDCYPSTRDIVSQILMRTRKPILAVPETQKQLSFGRALVTWDGSESCAATLRACTPLLARANEVEIFAVRDGTENLDPEEAAEYLSRHGVHANIRTVEGGGEKPDAAIDEECTRWHPDYVVMGAYGHGRLRETFGGVTKRLLGRARLPILLGH